MADFIHLVTSVRTGAKLFRFRKISAHSHGIETDCPAGLLRLSGHGRPNHWRGYPVGSLCLYLVATAHGGRWQGSSTPNRRNFAVGRTSLILAEEVSRRLNVSQQVEENKIFYCLKF